MALDLRGIKAATFNTPTNYVESVRYYEQNLQDKINDTYQYASDTYEIGQEIVAGTLDFCPLVCRVCHAINPKTGLNLGDDFKDLKFFDVFSHRTMGERYEFNGSVWITTNTDNYHYNTQSAIVRRCNNTLNYIDTNGKIIREPCIVGYSVKYANIYYNTSVETPQGTIIITAQNNSNTQGMNINDRFILNNQVFKIKSIKDYLRSDTSLGSSVPLIEFELYIDAKSPDDNFELGVANMNKYIGIYPPKPKVLNEVIVEPEFSKLYQGETRTYTCYYYINNIKQPNEFIFEPKGAHPNLYSLTVIDGNTFTVTCLGKSTNLLVVNCIGDIISSDSAIVGEAVVGTASVGNDGIVGKLEKEITIDLRGLY